MTALWRAVTRYGPYRRPIAAVPPVQPAFACSAGTRARRSKATGLPGVAERRQGCSETQPWSVPRARAHRVPDPASDQLI
jgi:hypothetical protein